MSFGSLGLHSSLVEPLAALGYTAPTPVQLAAIPAALAGADLLVSSPTGSGKTAAFMLPALNRLVAAAAAAPAENPYRVDRSAKLAARGRPFVHDTSRSARGPRILVIAPTRELALQVIAAAHGYAGRRLRSALLVGGMPYNKQLEQLRAPLDLVVATPGRLKDHMDRGRLDLSRVEVLVLDEADRMLDMGFAEDIDAIVAATPGSRQTLLFSATLDGVVGKLAARVTRTPQRISVGAAAAAEKLMIDQSAIFADGFGHKSKLLDALLRDTALTQALVFTATKRSAEELSQSLALRGFAAGALHGDMRQNERNRAMQRMREGRTRVLIATDVAARGLDVPGISHVINFDAPRGAEDYVHRIGRTGRAGRTGVAVTLLGREDRNFMRTIERHTGRPMRVAVIPGLEQAKRRPESAKPAAQRLYSRVLP
jgi:superfamily II DNA/RNA helicase